MCHMCTFAGEAADALGPLADDAACDIEIEICCGSVLLDNSILRSDVECSECSAADSAVHESVLSFVLADDDVEHPARLGLVPLQGSSELPLLLAT